MNADSAFTLIIDLIYIAPFRVPKDTNWNKQKMERLSVSMEGTAAQPSIPPSAPQGTSSRCELASGGFVHTAGGDAGDPEIQSQRPGRSDSRSPVWRVDSARVTLPQETLV